MKTVEWKTYRTRFLVQAKQLNYALTFIDSLGRQHCGRKGDYLVESSEGVLSIAPRRIFEDIYVPMSALAEPQACEAQISQPASGENTFVQQQIQEVLLADLPMEALGIEQVGTPLTRKPAAAQLAPPDEAARVRRKLPQPFRDRRSSPSRLNLM